ncbi:O-antigen ligase family protein [Paenisporosarcina indica]|uniref:O-antigen ligase family protein n=1 Tax=Paenisporosarcina indica TaxID=650093 RepID=UPI0009503317|nr:O-antigen ligase family protein [Paenisporosarcina indica]
MKLSIFNEQWKVVGVGVILLILALVLPLSMIAYLSTVIIGILAFMKPKESMFLLLFYFPLRSFIIEINPSLKLVGDLIIVAAFLRVLWNSRTNPKSIFKFEKFEWAFIAFLVVGAISAFITGVSLGAIVFQLRAFAITFLILYIVKRLGITKQDIKMFLWTTFIVAMILVVQGLVEKLSMRSAWMPEFWINRSLSPNNKVRIYGLINNPNVLAVFLTISAILTVYLKMLLPKNKVQWLLNISLVLMSGVWILTYSRGTWIAFAIGLAIYVLYTRNWKFLVKTAVVVGLSFVLVMIPATNISQWISSNTEIGNFERTGPAEVEGFAVEKNRITETFNKSTLEKSMTTGRLYIVAKGFEIFKDYPIIGTGFATFGDSASKSYSSPIYKDYDIGYDIYADNQYIQIITQTGVVGVLLFAVFLLGMLVLFWKYRKSSPYAIPMVAGLIGVFWCGLIYNIWEDKTFTMYFYFLTAAFLLAVTKKERATR